MEPNFALPVNFNRETQVEHCDKRLIKPDGSIILGTTESRYSFGDGKTLKMTVTPKMVRYPIH
jgi:hypothetical protein